MLYRVQDSNPAHDLLPITPSILQLSEANDEGGTIPSQDLNSAPELATAPLSIQQCQVKEGGITILSQESMLVQKLALPPPSETTGHGAHLLRMGHRVTLLSIDYCYSC